MTRPDQSNLHTMYRQCAEENSGRFGPDACRTDCTNARCGDGAVDSGEVCDDGYTEFGGSVDSRTTERYTSRCPVSPSAQRGAENRRPESLNGRTCISNSLIKFGGPRAPRVCLIPIVAAAAGPLDGLSAGLGRHPDTNRNRTFCFPEARSFGSVC